jgi:chromosome partitioning protein
MSLQKGGTGKTTTTVNVAGALAGHFGLRVLVLDYDPQCNATQTLLPAVQLATEPTIADVLSGRLGLAEAVQAAPGAEGRLHVLPGSLDLAKWERQIPHVDEAVAVMNFRTIIHDGIPAGAYDVVLVDTPPSLSGLWLMAALAIADGVIMVAEAERYSLWAVKTLHETFESMRAQMNPSLEYDGFIVSRVVARRDMPKGFVDAYRQFTSKLGIPLYDPPVPNWADISAAASCRQPVEMFAPSSEAASVYRRIAGQLIAYRGLGRPRGGSTAQAPAIAGAA